MTLFSEIKTCFLIFHGADFGNRVTLSFIGFGVLLATVHDAWRMFRGIEFVSKTDNSFVTALHCFSALSNGRKLLSLTPAATGSDNLSCLHGIRFLSTCWVVLGHTWLKSATSNVANPKMVAQVKLIRFLLLSPRRVLPFAQQCFVQFKIFCLSISASNELANGDYHQCYSFGRLFLPNEWPTHFLPSSS